MFASDFCDEKTPNFHIIFSFESLEKFRRGV